MRARERASEREGERTKTCVVLSSGRRFTHTRQSTRSPSPLADDDDDASRYCYKRLTTTRNTTNFEHRPRSQILSATSHVHDHVVAERGVKSNDHDDKEPRCRRPLSSTTTRIDRQSDDVDERATTTAMTTTTAATCDKWELRVTAAIVQKTRALNIASSSRSSSLSSAASMSSLD